MSQPLSETVVLGVLQGVTEFLPVSSSGHVALAQILFGIEEAGITLNVMLHAGTLIATVAVLRRRVARAVVEGARALPRPARFSETSGGRDALVVILATLPTAIIGFSLRHVVERWSSSPLVVGIGFIITSLVLLSTRYVRTRDAETPTVVAALLIGLAQGCAVLPGISRSGSTIAAALWLGVRPDRAFELSMLMSLPAILGAVILEAPKLGGNLTGVGMAAMGAAVACGVGVGAMYALRKVVVRGHFALFAIWTIPLGIATLAMAKAWPGG